MSPVLSARVFRRLYRDSVTLMSMASVIERHEGIERVGAVMATSANLAILSASGMLPADVTAAADDLIIVVRGASEDEVDAALDAAERALTEAADNPRTSTEHRWETVSEAVEQNNGLTLAAVSTPGTYAPIVVEQALSRGLHVFCFSDNVDVTDERRLKELAVSRRALLMGPDCGTAIIDGVPLGFANNVARGPVGIVAASGTGAQEVSTLLDRHGVGISQLIGVGGRDLSAEVNGLMTHLALDLVADDVETSVVVVVSKPPATEVAARLLERLATLGKPAVACLLGAEDADGPVIIRGTLEGGAIAAAGLAGVTIAMPTDGAPATSVPVEGGVLGLFAGGTLAGEAKVLLGRAGITATIIDLGDDEYTAGRPHPMIDPSLRVQRVIEAGRDARIGVLLVDIVLGHGASSDPAGPIAEAVQQARAIARADGRELVVVGSICGTARDPQPLDAQRQVLEAVGIEVHPSNAAAVRRVISLMNAQEKETVRA